MIKNDIDTKRLQRSSKTRHCGPSLSLPARPDPKGLRGVSVTSLAGRWQPPPSFAAKGERETRSPARRGQDGGLACAPVP